jgi:hypothetical protein
MRTAKAVVAAIGSTLTALSTAAATASVVLGDDKIDLGEISTITTAVVSLVATIYAVWRVPNQPAAEPAPRPLRR